MLINKLTILLQPMNFLFLSNSRFTQAPYNDASFRYRCYNHAEDLVHQGHTADVALANDIDTRILNRYDAVVYLRPKSGRQIDRILKACRQANCTTIADFDDLIFVPDHAHHSPAVVNQRSTERQVKALFTRHQEAMIQFDAVSVATAELAVHAKHACPDKKVFLLENGLSRFWLSGNPSVHFKDNSTKISTNKRFITYFPGSRSHDADFKTAEPVIADLLEDNPDLTLRIIGSLSVNESQFNDNQLLRQPWVNYWALPALIESSFFTIAPLADTVFNRCKSHIKFIESAAFGTPIIASENPDIARHDVDGLMQSDNAQDWHSFTRKLRNPVYYSDISATLFNYARTRCMNGTGAEQLRMFTHQIRQQKNAESRCLAKAS